MAPSDLRSLSISTQEMLSSMSARSSFSTRRPSKGYDRESGDAVNSFVYEATARVEDPVYGCTRATHHLQKRIADLESQLAATQAELLNMRFTNDKPVYALAFGCDDAGNLLYSKSQQS
ncbi:hypothetical protein SUGI_0892390 [Cryptomeria japonica]|nr:hypothetical protein SUGI_0892390 [Cryptomeria japonica]